MKSNRTITINPTARFTSKTPQVNQLQQALVDCGKTSITEQDLSSVLRGKITTRQDTGLIFRYYQKVLITAGFIKLDGFVPRVTVDVAPSNYYNYDDYAKKQEPVAAAPVPTTPAPEKVNPAAPTGVKK